MRKLKDLLKEFRVENLDTDKELDLDELGELDIDQIRSGFFSDEEDPTIGSVDFDDLAGLTLADLAAHYDSQEEDGVPLDTEQAEEDQIDMDKLDGFSVNTGNPLQQAQTGVADVTMAQDGIKKVDELVDDEEKSNTVSGLPDIGEEEEDGDADFQGEIRTVRGANLVYKRKNENGNFEELWVYNVGNDIKRESQIRRAILAGTDINPNTEESEDGEQYADTSTIGNVQFLNIVGIPQ
jgi:hypothetical protein